MYILVARHRRPPRQHPLRSDTTVCAQAYGTGAKCGVGTYSNKAYCGHADFKKACCLFCSNKTASPTQSTTSRPTAACADAYEQCGGKSQGNWNNNTGATDPRVSLPAGGQPLLRARLPDSNPTAMSTRWPCCAAQCARHPASSWES